MPSSYVARLEAAADARSARFISDPQLERAGEDSHPAPGVHERHASIDSVAIYERQWEELFAATDPGGPASAHTKEPSSPLSPEGVSLQSGDSGYVVIGPPVCSQNASQALQQGPCHVAGGQAIASIYSEGFTAGSEGASTDYGPPLSLTEVAEILQPQNCPSETAGSGANTNPDLTPACYMNSCSGINPSSGGCKAPGGREQSVWVPDSAQAREIYSPYISTDHGNQALEPDKEYIEGEITSSDWVNLLSNI